MHRLRMYRIPRRVSTVTIFLWTVRWVQTVARLCGNEGKFEELWNLKDLMRDMVNEGGLARPGSSIYVSLVRVGVGAGVRVGI